MRRQFGCCFRGFWSLFSAADLPESHAALTFRVPDGSSGMTADPFLCSVTPVRTPKMNIKLFLVPRFPILFFDSLRLPLVDSPLEGHHKMAAPLHTLDPRQRPSSAFDQDPPLILFPPQLLLLNPPFALAHFTPDTLPL